MSDFPSPTYTLAPRSALAACSTRQTKNVRVYSQTKWGDLRESCIDGGAWYVGSNPLPVPTKLQRYSPIAATSDDEAINKHLRVFYLNEDTYINEICYTHAALKWYPGTLNDSGIKAAEYSQLAAVHWDDQNRLYYQGTDNKIYELTQSGESPWQPGHTIVSAIPGTRISVVRSPKDTAVRLFYQGEDFQTYQISSSDGWSKATVVAPALSPALGHLSAASWGSEIHLYATNIQNPVGVSEIQASATGMGGVQSWSSPTLVANSIPITSIASVCYLESNSPRYRVYFQEDPNFIMEYKKDGDGSWVRGGYVPLNLND